MQSADRKLAAILVADVVAYSRLMRENETETLLLVRRFAHDRLLPALTRHSGRLVKDMGDGFLAVFESAVRAVECAVELQKQLVKTPLSMGAEQLKVRIGLNVGDVIFEANDVFGDGVNVAARLQPLCSPGGVCLSETIYEQVRDKLPLELESLGAQALKNINRPVEAWLWSGHHASGAGTKLRGKESQPVEMPSIAVLAFDYMSADPELAFFADGISEDITTALSRIGQFFVVSRTSSFSFKGQKADAVSIARKLGVRYVVEGSVRTAAKRLRITAQLIDASEGKHIWAQKYDRNYANIFDIQDEITRNVVASLQTHIELAEGAAVRQSDTISLPVWKLVNLSWTEIYKMTPESLDTAIGLAKKATEMDPASGRAFQVLSSALYHQASTTFPTNADMLFDEALEAAKEAVILTPDLEYAFWARGLALGAHGEVASAINDFERAIELNPNCSLAYGSMAFALVRAGRFQESLDASMIALNSNPLDPSVFFRYSILGYAAFFMGDHEAAEKWCRKAITLKPTDFGTRTVLIAILQSTDRLDEAKHAVAECRKLFPTASLRWAARYNTSREPEASQFLELLSAAGLS
ncbi:MAG: adenylate/guanylate cyclase domain-containing protein [Cypionkella sp.]